MAEKLSSKETAEKLPQLVAGLSVLSSAVLMNQNAVANQINNCRVVQSDQGEISDVSLGNVRIIVPTDGSPVLFSTITDVNGSTSDNQLCSVRINEGITEYTAWEPWCGSPAQTERTGGFFDDPIHPYQTVTFSNNKILHASTRGPEKIIEEQTGDSFQELTRGRFLTKIEGKDIAVTVENNNFDNNGRTIVVRMIYPENNDFSDVTIELNVGADVPLSTNTTVKGITSVGNYLLVTIGDLRTDGIRNEASILAFELSYNEDNLPNEVTTFQGHIQIDGETDTIGAVEVNQLNNSSNPLSSENILAMFRNSQYIVCNDIDADGIADGVDNCPNTNNADQLDSNENGTGDACEQVNNDIDGDGVPDDIDNCPNTPNPDQADGDGDGIGIACDPEESSSDSDADGVADPEDNCLHVQNRDQADFDLDGEGDACDEDIDGDGINNECDSDPYNGIGSEDDCEVADTDADGVADPEDNCPNTSNPNQINRDGDEFGDACDNDIDGDGTENASDPCPEDALNECEDPCDTPVRKLERPTTTCELDQPVLCPDGVTEYPGTWHLNNADRSTCQLVREDGVCYEYCMPECEVDESFMCPSIDGTNNDQNNDTPGETNNNTVEEQPPAPTPEPKEESCSVVEVNHRPTTPSEVAAGTSMLVLGALAMAAYAKARHTSRK